MRSRGIVSLLAVFGALLAAPGAWAATLSVDDDGKDCPAAPFTSVQAAIDAAAPGDTVAICTGTYAEGSGAIGSNALTIAKDLTLKGMGADRVRIQARRTSATGGEIATTPANLLDGRGDLVAVNGTPGRVLTVELSGVTLDGNGVVVEAGVVYRDAQGSVSKSRITNVVTSEAADAFNTPGGWRNPVQPGIGVAQVTAGDPAPPATAPRTLTVENTRIDRYNAAGVLFEGRAGVDQRGVVIASEVVGRVLCQNFAANGDCSAPGLVTTGPLFGQDGVRVTSRARATIRSSMVTQNLVNGLGAPVRQKWSADGQTLETPGTAGRENLARAAGIRLADADAGNSLITRNNIVDNAYGVLNVAADGSTPSTVAVPAPDNWWGLRYTPLPPGSSTTNPGPAIDPPYNPPVPENPVNSAVSFLPYRSGPQSDPRTGQFPNIQAPNTDVGPSATLAVAPGTARRGQEITLTATATDDFGIRQVTFYDGSRVLATDAAPPYAATVRIPDDAPCVERSYTVVVEDAIGQTASAAASVRVVGCPPAEQAPPPVQPTAPQATSPALVPPSASFAGSIAMLEQGGADVSVNASSPAGVARVEWFLGDRLVCADTAAPFSCRVVPRVGDVGMQSLRVVVTGNDGLTTTVARQVQVARFRARGVAVSIKKTRIAGGRIVRRVTATLLRPAGTAARDTCVNSTMTLVVNRRYRGFVNQVRRLRSNCTVSLSFTDRPATKRIYSISARFGGNTVLRPAVKYRRFS